MTCDECEFKKEILKLDEFCKSAVEFICGTCPALDKTKSACRELDLEIDMDLVDVIKQVYSEVKDIQYTAEIFDLPVDLIKKAIKK